MQIRKLALFGVGRFGRMVLKYLPRDCPLVVYDEDPEKVQDLAQAGSFEEAVRADALILCVPISTLPRLCRDLQPHLRKGQLVIDTCSVKERPLQWMTRYLPQEVQILGSHPLFGPDSGKEGIAGLKIVLCPVRVRDEVYACVKSYLQQLQLVVIESSPEEHDQQIARSQAVFHFIAQALKELGWEGQAISTPGPERFFRLVRTVQRDTDQLFLDMERENRFAARQRQEFLDKLIELHRRLSQGE